MEHANAKPQLGERPNGLFDEGDPIHDEEDSLALLDGRERQASGNNRLAETTSTGEDLALVALPDAVA
ncbi:hypothetical protein D779_0352 [Imhoffiella purpurea]|uniref:Uncharacterized protein n=1 Tax=Imhoffiella purpurea TaxID=1249627 RepID=W9UUK5_9GAMM|nr:hypothetical protein D779_0352 [Imhoffiella purpurea]